MQKKFLSSLFITLSANLLVKPIWILGIDRTFQNRLGLEEYGSYTNLFAFSLILGLLLDFGINNYNSSSLARNPQLLEKQFFPLLLIKIGLSFLYVLFTLTFGTIYGFNTHELSLLGLLCINQCLAYASTFFRSTLSGLQLYKTDALISSVDRLTMLIGGTSILIWGLFPISVITFIYLQTFGYLVAMLVSLSTLIPHLKFAIQLNIQHVLPSLKRSLPFAVLALIMTLYSRADVLLIKKMLPDGDLENGIYAQSTRLLEAVNMIAVLVSGLLLPMFSAMLKERQPIAPLIKLAMLVLLVPAIIGVIGCYVYSHEIFALLYDQYNPYHAKVFVFCISSALPMCTMYIFGTLLTANKNFKSLIQTAVVALMLNISANYFLIPRMGAEGAAIAALLTSTLVAMVNTIAAKRKLRIRISFIHFVKFPLFAFLCFGVLTVLVNNGYSFPIVLSAYLLASAFFVLMLQIIDITTLKKALKRFQ
jgi:O-antigen/teichoic acid export membrane protein